MPARWIIGIAICGFGVACGIYWLLFHVPYLVFVRPTEDRYRTFTARAAEQHEKDSKLTNRWARELCSNCGKRDVGADWNRVKGTMVSAKKARASEVDWVALGLTAKDAATIIEAKDDWPALRGTGKIKYLRPKLIRDLRPTDYWELPESAKDFPGASLVRGETLFVLAKAAIASAGSEAELRTAFADVSALASLSASTQTRTGTLSAIALVAVKGMFQGRLGKRQLEALGGSILTRSDEERLRRMAAFSALAMHPLTDVAIRVKALRSESDFSYCGALIQQATSMAAMHWVAATTFREPYESFDRVIRTSKVCRLGRARELWQHPEQEFGVEDHQFREAFGKLNWVPMLFPLIAKDLMAISADIEMPKRGTPR